MVAIEKSFRSRLVGNYPFSSIVTAKKQLVISMSTDEELRDQLQISNLQDDNIMNLPRCVETWDDPSLAPVIGEVSRSSLSR